MRGAIHGIWLVTPGGKLHKAIIPTLSSWLPAATESDFQVILWTNVEQLAPAEISRLNAANIKIGDPRDLKDSPLYKHYEYFLQKGVAGDITAFALASDILRMTILDFSAANKYFIYIDPNDITLLNLANNLQNLDTLMHTNKLGFSFPVGPVAIKTDVFDIRNDVLIALKANNPQFFKDYLTAYWANLEQSYQRYEKPTSDAQAKFFANRITNSTSFLFFRLEPAKDQTIKVIAQFAKTSAPYQIVNSNSYLTYRRTLEHANSWAPVGSPFDVHDEIAMNTNLIESIIAEQQETTKPVIENKTISAATYASILCIVLLAVLCFKVIKSRLIKKG